MCDWKTFDHELSKEIANDFPCRKHLSILSSVRQSDQQDANLITFPHSKSLNLHNSHIDYVEQLLCNVLTRSPSLCWQTTTSMIWLERTCANILDAGMNEYIVGLYQVFYLAWSDEWLRFEIVSSIRGINRWLETIRPEYDPCYLNHNHYEDRSFAKQKRLGVIGKN